MNLFDAFDQSLANELGVDVKEYIDKIESLSDKRMELILLALVSEDPIKVEKAKRIFKLI
jgi:hypothetical protein